MSFRPYGTLSDWMPIEAFFRSLYLFEQNPTEENRQMVHAARAAASHAPEVAHFQGRKMPDHIQDSLFFHDDYPLAVVKHPRYTPADRHSHDFFELIYVLQGTCQNQLRDLSIPMKAGDLCILPPHQPHSLLCQCDDGIILNILIRTSAFQQSIQPLLSDFGPVSHFFNHTLFQKKNSAYLLFSCGKDAVLQRLAEEMFTEYSSFGSFSPTLLTGLFLQFMSHLMRSHQQDLIQLSGSQDQPPAQVVEMLRHVADHLADITLQDLAQQFNYSASRCSTIIKEATGKTFQQLLREARAHHAAQLLLSADLSMSQIAEQAGFCDTSHFYRVFSSIHGMTPKQYKQQHTSTAT